MPKVGKDEITHVEKIDGYEGRFEEVDEFTIAFEDYTVDTDPDGLFIGLTDDRCQSRHWGYVIKGELTYTYADGSTEVVRSGEAYYARPGHRPLYSAETEVVEFSFTEELRKTIDVVMKNAADSGLMG